MSTKFITVMSVTVLLLSGGPALAQPWQPNVDWKVVFPWVINETCNNDPRIFELMKDQEVDLLAFFSDANLMPLLFDPTTPGPGGISYRGNATYQQIMRDTVLSWDGVNTDTDTYRLYATMSGVKLQLKRGFRWDGPSVPAIGGCNPSNWQISMMRSSAVHDALYDWMRLKRIDRDPYGLLKADRIKTAGWKNRLTADTLIYLISKQDGLDDAMNEPFWHTLRDFGRDTTHDGSANCPRPHARAEAVQPPTCTTTGSFCWVSLDATPSRWATSWSWSWLDENGNLAVIGPTDQVVGAPFWSGNHAVTLTVTDGDDHACQPHWTEPTVDLRDTAFAVFRVNRAPTADAGPDQAIECVAEQATPVTLDGSGSFDPDGDPLTYLWTGPFGTATDVSPMVSLPLGVHTVTLQVDDGDGGTATDTVMISILDTGVPTLSVSLSPNMLWPPNNKLHTITAAVEASDSCSNAVTVELLSIVDDEGSDPSDVTEAAFGTGDRLFDVRAQRNGAGYGRVYTVTYGATDPSGNLTTASATVSVPHDQRNSQED